MEHYTSKFNSVVREREREREREKCGVSFELFDKGRQF